MSESEPIPVVDDQKPAKKKRSPWERAVVWGGILLMLFVVLMEWKSREGHDATVSGLEEILGHGKTIPLAELQNHVHGYAIRGEAQNGKERMVTLRWPSLFKQYALYLPAEHNDQISSFDTAESRANPPPPAVAGPEGPASPVPNAMPTGPIAPANEAPSDGGERRKISRPD